MTRIWSTSSSSTTDSPAPPRAGLLRQRFLPRSNFRLRVFLFPVQALPPPPPPKPSSLLWSETAQPHEPRLLQELVMLLPSGLSIVLPPEDAGCSVRISRNGFSAASESYCFRSPASSWYGSVVEENFLQETSLPVQVKLLDLSKLANRVFAFDGGCPYTPN